MDVLGWKDSDFHKPLVDAIFDVPSNIDVVSIYTECKHNFYLNTEHWGDEEDKKTWGDNDWHVQFHYRLSAYFIDNKVRIGSFQTKKELMVFIDMVSHSCPLFNRFMACLNFDNVI